ncbi:MAG: 5-formyltetrahydrofolate cyclo-ligase [Alkalinema sp. CAN_BIN05]|nr:5-formyltetrahydrofolate cyclo-ligase [Alkalinema sp. CAN_BIN05]
MNKAVLRQDLLRRRIAMNATDWNDRNALISQKILQNLPSQPHLSVLAYFSIRQEPDLSNLWLPLRSRSIPFGVPRCVDNQLVWHRWEPGNRVVVGAFGILEPEATAPVLQAKDVGLILVPCVGCDRRGNRIGYGGGFYDRLLAQTEWRSIPTVGITFDFGVVESFEADEWDQSLNYICTETNWIVCNELDCL